MARLIAASHSEKRRVSPKRAGFHGGCVCLREKMKCGARRAYKAVA
jgi:hypothetical protein